MEIAEENLSWFVNLIINDRILILVIKIEDSIENQKQNVYDIEDIFSLFAKQTVFLLNL